MNRSSRTIAASLRLGRLQPYIAPLALFLLSSLLVYAGAKFGMEFFKKGHCTGHYFGYASWFSNWDGQWYQFIFQHGYAGYGRDGGGYGPQVFFPLYPLLGSMVRTLTGANGEFVLPAISWCATALFSGLWIHYAQEKFKQPLNAPIVILSLALILFWPVSYFMRAAYTESLFILILVLFLLGLAKRWPIFWLIILCGLLTATRPTGLAACPALALHAWFRLKDKTPFSRLFLTGAIGAVSAWGLYSYMLYLYLTFGDPLLFLTKQLAWNYKQPSDIFFLRWQEMLSLRPIWHFMVDGSLRNVETYPWNIQNCFMTLLAIPLIGIGIYKKWMTCEEFVFCTVSLLFFYVANAPKGMESIGRYLLSLLPLYIVMARLLSLFPLAVWMGTIAILGAFLFLQTGLFSLWYCVF